MDHMTRAIATIAVDDLAKQWAAVTRQFLEHYAEKTEADIIDGQFHEHPEISSRFTQIQLSKLDIMREALAEYDRVLWIDADVMIRPDAPDIFEIVPAANWAGIDEVSIMLRLNWLERYEMLLQHMETVRLQEGLPAINRNRAIYFNCGVQLANRSHAFLYEPAKNPDDFDWAEQTRVSVRAHLAAEAGKLEIYYLPDCFNCMKWAGTLDYLRTAWFNHYCGMKGDQRLFQMTVDAEHWRKRYGYLNERLRAR